jgi:hypothetical protein
VGGLTIRRLIQHATERRLVADLVVDASGRSSRAQAWVEEMGYERPEEERIEIGVGYTTRIYRSRPDDLSGAKLVIVEPTPGRERSIGAMFRMEEERWIVALGGWLGERAPTDEAGFIEFACNLPGPDIHEVIKDAGPLGDAVKFSFPANQRRRYERVSRLLQRRHQDERAGRWQRGLRRTLQPGDLHHSTGQRPCAVHSPRRSQP